MEKRHSLWEFDIKYATIHGDNRSFFICGFIDVFTRDLIDYHIGYRCQAQDILRTLKIALQKEGIRKEDNLFIRSDNGTQMTSNIFKQGIKDLPSTHEFTPKRCPDKNAHIESFFSVLERNVFEGRVFKNYGEAYALVEEFIQFYRNERIHGALKMSPRDFIKKLPYLKPENYAVLV